MSTPSQYLETLLGLVEPFGIVRMPLDGAQGAVIAHDVVAASAIPRFDASAMDGFAVRADEVGTPLRVMGDLPAGTGLNPSFGPGECVAIMTGAPLPDAADTVVPIERVDVQHAASGDIVTVNEPDAVVAGQHIRRAGEDVNIGDTVIGSGARITSGVLATLSACGIAVVPVRRRARVAVAATGDELRPVGTQLAYGQIYESNAVFVGGLLKDADVSVKASLPDDASAIRAALDAWANEADVIVLTGGAGGGAHDVPGQVVATAAEHGSARVTMQPGKPQAWARWHNADGNSALVLVLPGNPLAAAVSAQVFVVPLLAQLMGSEAPEPVQAELTAPLRGRTGKTQFIPVTTHVDGGRFQAQAAHVRGLGSHLVSTLSRANGLAVIPSELSDLPAGALVDVLPFG